MDLEISPELRVYNPSDSSRIYYPTDRVARRNFVYKKNNPPAEGLGLCEGDCDNDSHCKGNLKCDIRKNTNPPPIGTVCSEDDPGSLSFYDYCFDKPYTNDKTHY